MKFLPILLLALVASACDPYGFGFKKNPAYALNEAFNAVQIDDQEAFLSVTGREVLCLYGNPQGMQFLREQLQINLENVDLTPFKQEAEYFTAPQFVGYWSYYQERYLVDIKDKKTGKAIIKVVVDCHYGVEGQKEAKYLNLSPSKYKNKECKITKILPATFSNLPISSKCEQLKVNL